MELLDSLKGSSGLLAGIVIILSLNLTMRIGEFVIGMMKKKAENSDRQLTEHSLALTQNTQAVRDLRVQLGMIERELIEMKKHGPDINTAFFAIRYIAETQGIDWSDVRKAMDDAIFPR